VDPVRVNREQQRGLPLAGVQAALRHRDVELLLAELGDPEENPEIGDRDDVVAVLGRKLLDRRRQGAKLPP
jgi:hypothetical protein